MKDVVTRTREEGNIVVYTREEINRANLTSSRGATRIVWRQTEPGDYPELKPGQQLVFPDPIREPHVIGTQREALQEVADRGL